MISPQSSSMPSGIVVAFLVLLSICENASSQSILWPLSAQDDNLQLIDWSDPYAPTDIPFNTTDRFACHGQAYDACGELVFVVAHDGQQLPNHLFCLDLDGNILGPGLNGIRASGEMEVVRVPGKLNEWYIIYSLYTDFEVITGNPLYTQAELAYSRVYYDCTDFVILEQDVVLEADGAPREYTHGKAVSATAAGDPNANYLYATRRPENYDFISVDRFLIDETGINWDINSGDVPCTYWSLTIAGSPVELSNDGTKLVVMNRDQDNFTPNRPDIYLFDALTLSLIQAISVHDQILQPDGSSVLTPASVLSASALPGLGYLRNLSRKIAFMEFSPSGQYLYFSNGGYASGGYSNLTYIGQLDLTTTYPHDLRIQTQAPPYGTYNNFTGAGCAFAAGTCLDDYQAVNNMQKAPDGNIYFTKRSNDTLFVLPDPDSPMPQQILPANINFETAAAPNIITNAIIGKLPDMIDGYDYSLPNTDKFYLPIEINQCGNCLATPASPKRVELRSSSDQLIKVVELTSCPDTMEVCLFTDSTYKLVYDGLEIVAVDMGVVNSPLIFSLPDSSLSAALSGPLSYCVTDPAGTYISTIPGGIYSGTGVVDSLSGVFDPSVAGVGNWTVSYYYDSAGCPIYADLDVNVYDNPLADAGPDHLIVSGSSATLLGSGGPNYNWSPDEWLDCNDCPNPIATPESTTWFYLLVENAAGCFSFDSVLVEVYDPGGVHFPNAFSPNGDLINDYFGPAYQSPDCELINFTVFNRWGEIVFQASNADQKWDGTFKGKDAEIGTYIYLANYRCLESQINEPEILLKGTMTLLR